MPGGGGSGGGGCSVVVLVGALSCIGDSTALESVHRAPRPLRPPAQGPLLWLPCGVEARSGYPAASRHAAATLRRRGTQRLLRARSQPLTIMERSRWTKLAEESISTALRLGAHGEPQEHTRHFDLCCLVVRRGAAGKIEGEPDVEDTAEHSLQAEGLDGSCFHTRALASRRDFNAASCPLPLPHAAGRS